MTKTPEQMAEECSEQFTEKQKLLLEAARTFAYAFVKTIPLVDNATEGRVNAFMTGYLKGLKDCGFDLFDAKSIEGLEVNNENT
ncbi:hypothetical protein UFOVP410_130 [uncultured Caudovirales phage]|uniref:Uncharacterized protein n=1 Tax=uncultured Caudovirales phage TaxID=2100421 RepID=A0A6J5M585_9CAUD|nr:hypothetical protein UFOVP410_130 [uncultured Caudovirales phage]